MVTKEDITSLIKDAKEPAISIYLPTHVKGEEVQQDPIRLKNLLNKAERKMHDDLKMSQPVIDEMLEEARDLLNIPDFWAYSDKGLAVFISPDFFETYRVPLNFKEQVLINDHFLITPLLPMISLNGTYCVAALSQKQIRLLRCTRETIRPIELKEVPTSMEEFTKFNVNERHLQHHTGGEGRAVFHGQGSNEDSEDEERVNYFKIAENEITDKVRRRNDPLILAGMNNTVGIYKKFNHYHRTMDEIIDVNPDPLSDDKLNKKAWEIIKSHFLQDMYQDKERFANLTGSDKQSDNLSQVVEASYYGKVDSLFVPIGEQSWGRFDAEDNTIEHSAEQQNGEYDLINMAAIKTLSQGGRVYALDKDSMPQGKSIAAIFRY